MQWLIGHWRVFAEWAAAQSVLVQIVVGSALLILAYAIFVCILTKLTGRPPVLTRHSSNTRR